MFAKLLPIVLLGAALVHAELPAEPMGVIRTLPVPYPAHWVLAHDGAFFHMSDGKVIVPKSCWLPKPFSPAASVASAPMC